MTTDTPRVRTSDAERERIAQTLRAAVGEGRLTLEEGDERLATLYTTKYRDELAPLIADLPASADDASRRAPGWGKGRNPQDEVWSPENESDPRGRPEGYGPWAGPGWGGHPHGPGAPGAGGPGWGGAGLGRTGLDTAPGAAVVPAAAAADPVPLRGLRRDRRRRSRSLLRDHPARAADASRFCASPGSGTGGAGGGDDRTLRRPRRPGGRGHRCLPGHRCRHGAPARRERDAGRAHRPGRGRPRRRTRGDLERRRASHRRAGRLHPARTRSRSRRSTSPTNSATSTCWPSSPVATAGRNRASR